VRIICILAKLEMAKVTTILGRRESSACLCSETNSKKDLKKSYKFLKEALSWCDILTHRC
jgi:hypothetical protein